MPSSEGAGGWAPLDHACRFCGGRIMGRGREVVCHHCGAAATGAVSAICGCGLKAGAKLFPFRCEVNPTPNAACPAKIVIRRTAPAKA